MTRRLMVVSLVTAVALAAAASSPAQEVGYRVTFPAPEHRWMQVEVTFTAVRAPLALRMSRSSPGRYALHEFAKNVYDLRAFDATGREIAVSRSDPYGWEVPAAPDVVRVAYKVYGEQVDGTYLAIDTTHAHMNMPAAFIWARGLADRPIRITFAPPAGARWKVATQLFATSDPWTFTAPNLQYFMDSPAELGPVWELRFTVPQPGGTDNGSFRIALHHAGDEAGAREYASGVRRIAAEEAAVFGEFPEYEPGAYTFLADYLPYATGDGMEHRNSAALTGRADLADPRARRGALSTVAHELFHAWNVERIRPASLEPFDFEWANMSGELWLAEGVTSYYGALVMQRAGLQPLDETARGLGALVDAVVNTPARRVRSVVEASRMAPFVDAARPVDPTNFEITHLSYYTWGAGLGLALDLALRDRSNGRVSLDDFMRAMWRAHGRPGGSAPGHVARPYTLDDVRDRLAEVSGDRAFAGEFVSRFVEGREAPDYARLLSRAGFVVRRERPGGAWIGDVSFDSQAQGVRLARLTAPGTPAYHAGLDRDDVIVAIDGKRVSAAADLAAALGARKPGDVVAIRFLRRGDPVTAELTLAEDPALEVVTVESTGARLSAEQRNFRAAWLSPKAAH